MRSAMIARQQIHRMKAGELSPRAKQRWTSWTDEFKKWQMALKRSA
jgi:hypothetical protein